MSIISSVKNFIKSKVAEKELEQLEYIKETINDYLFYLSPNSTEVTIVLEHLLSHAYLSKNIKLKNFYIEETHTGKSRYTLDALVTILQHLNMDRYAEINTLKSKYDRKCIELKQLQTVNEIILNDINKATEEALLTKSYSVKYKLLNNVIKKFIDLVDNKS